MNLTPREKDKLLVSVAAMVARGRLERGVKLNYPEAIALVTDFVVEGCPRWPFGCRSYERRGKGDYSRRRDGGHRRNDPRCASGSDFSRRNQTGHRARADKVGGARRKLVVQSTKYNPFLYHIEEYRSLRSEIMAQQTERSQIERWGVAGILGMYTGSQPIL